MTKSLLERLRRIRPPWAAALIAGAGIGVTLGAMAGAHQRRTPTNHGPRLATTHVVRATLATTATFNGTVGFSTGRAISAEPGGTITALPAAGGTVQRGQPLYWVDDQPVVVFYGSGALYRTLRLPPADAGNSTGPANQPASVFAALQTLQAARRQLAADHLTLQQDERQQATAGRVTQLQAQTQLRADSAALAAARSQLVADQRLGCPAASPTTVSSPSAPLSGSGGTGGSGGSGGAGGSGGSGGSSAARRARDTGGITTAGATAAPTTIATGTATTPPPVPPSVSGEQDSGETTTAATLSGVVAPGGATTHYHFEYGTSAAYGAVTPDMVAGPGTGPVPVSAQLTGLRPNTTYLYALVATSEYGTATGIAETFTTAPSSCVQERQTIAGDRQTVSQDKLILRSDRASGAASTQTALAQLRTDREIVRSDVRALRRAQESSPRPDRTLMSGADVALAAQNLAALGYYSDAQIGSRPAYTPALAAAVRRWQAAVGMIPTGRLAPAQVVILGGPARVAAVQAVVGGHTGGQVLTLSGTTKLISFSGSGQLQPGQHVTVSVAGGPPAAGKIVSATPDGNRLAATASVDQPRALPGSGPATVSVTLQRRAGVLAVPVEALLARPSGGYALQLPGGRQLPVRVGLIAGDQAEVSGPGLRAGLAVVTAV